MTGCRTMFWHDPQFRYSGCLQCSNDLVVGDPVGLVTCESFWISMSVTIAFSWISARNSGCEQPLETWNRGKSKGWSAGYSVRSKKWNDYFGHTIRLTLSQRCGTRNECNVVCGQSVRICTCCVRGVTVHTSSTEPQSPKVNSRCLV